MLPAGSVDVDSAPSSRALLVDDALAADDDDVLLQVVELLHPLDEQLDVERMLGHQDDVRLAVGRAERDVAGVPAHHFDDGDAAVAFRGGADALDALRGHEHGRGVAGRDVVDDLVEIEDGARRACACSDSRCGAAGILAPAPIRPARSGSSGRGRCRSSSARARSAGARPAAAGR